MSEVVSVGGDQTTPDAVRSASPGALRAVREQAGLHVTALAATLKVSPHKLEALEAGRYDELPDMTFARALAKSVCRVLKVDPAPILATLPQPEATVIKDPNAGLNTPFPVKMVGASGKVASDSGFKQLPKPAALMLVVLVLAAVLWFVLPDAAMWPQPSVEPSPVSTVAETSAAEPAEPWPAPVAPVVSAEPQAVNVAASLAAPTESVPVPVAVPAEPATTAPADAAPVPAEALRLRARASSWVQVTGASGRLLLQRHVQAGEEVNLGADLPLSVVLGRADAMEVWVRGAAFEVTPFVRNNVARFEVK